MSGYTVRAFRIFAYKIRYHHRYKRLGDAMSGYTVIFKNEKGEWYLPVISETLYWNESKELLQELVLEDMKMFSFLKGFKVIPISEADKYRK